MENVDITKTTKQLIKYGLVSLIALSTAIGSATFNYYHHGEVLKIDNAKVVGTMVSVRLLTNGKVKELTKTDGDEVKAGDVIAKIEVNITEEEIKQLENTVELAKQNYAKLQVGQMVKVPVMKPKPVEKPKPTIQSKSRTNSSGASLSALEERKNRMELLFEMGAISKNQRDAAVNEYEKAKAAAAAPVEPEVSETSETSSDSKQDYEIEYVEQLQPTPPEILNGAQLAIKQAELSLNVAKQEAQQTEIIAPIDGVIYYNVEVDSELTAGDIVAKVGDSSDLWLEAEVSESQFDKMSLGNLVDYTIDNKKLTGTIIDKIEPVEEEIADETELIEEKSEQIQENEQNIPSQTKLNDNNPHQKNKYIVKFSLPVERDFECKPNMNVTINMKV